MGLQAAVEEKVLERAAQKLRLDQLVIQQGRQAPSKNQSSSKDEILDMVQHGAERILNSDTTMTVDDDIDTIISKGEERTAQLSDKYSSFNLHDLANFTSDAPGTTSWEGQQFGNKVKRIGNLWIEPSKRERKSNYSVDAYYKENMHTSGRRAGPLKAPRPLTARKWDFQLYPQEYYKLQDKEIAYFQVRCSSTSCAIVFKAYTHFAMRREQKEQGYVVPLPLDKSKTQEEAEVERQAAQDVIDNGRLDHDSISKRPCG